MEQEIKGIVFKGNSEGLVIVIPDDYEFEQVLSEVERKVTSASRFFKGARIKVSYRGPKFTDEQEQAVKAILDEKSGAIIESFTKDEGPAREISIRQSGAVSAMPVRSAFFAGIDEGNCKFVRSTVRNGIRIEYNGNVVVLGDVNPGAEIIAAGNVIVLGILRGMVHAGADGNKDAFIYALSLKPTQIRIAEAIARMPDDDESESGICPEMATVKDGGIVVEQM